DRFVIRFDNRPFHSSCLRCSVCRVELANDQSAFIRDGMLLCKNDFEGYNNYVLQNCCATCKKQFSVADMVARAGHQYAHADCVCCTLCKQKLEAGREIIVDPAQNFLCRTHLDAISLPPFSGFPHPSLLLPPSSASQPTVTRSFPVVPPVTHSLP
ncbi:hypothetical protein PENTCL1PPCAC_27202, partial [Pristionchus entomophagus]